MIERRAFIKGVGALAALRWASPFDWAAAAARVKAGMPSVREIRRWHLESVAKGPRHTGNAAHKAHLNWLFAQLKSAGLEVARETHTFPRWEARSWSLTVDRRRVPNTSYYPYSGATGGAGVSGELVYVGTGAGGAFTELAGKDLAGKIAVFDAPTPHGLTWAPFFASNWYLHDPDGTVTPTTEIALSPAAGMLVATPVDVLREAGAVGAVGLFDVSPRMASGTYAPFLWPYQDLPALWLDRDQAAVVKQRATAGGKIARIVLRATQEPEATSDHLIAVLPGKTDEIIFLNTHSDGPNSIEENGTLALLAIAKHFASVPIEKRQRTLMFFFRTGHFTSGTLPNVGEWLAEHPEVRARIVAALTIEHLGSREWVDSQQGYKPTGLHDVTISYVSENPTLVVPVIDAVQKHDIRRTFVLRHTPIGGEGTIPRMFGIPTFFWIAGPSWIFSMSEQQHVDKVDPVRFRKTVQMFATVIDAIDELPAVALAARSESSDVLHPQTDIPAPVRRFLHLPA